MRRDKNRSVPELTENDYDWGHALLVELVGAVGENETHPLRPLMEFVCRLIDNYEDKYVPELIELFPELAEEGTIKTAKKNKEPDENTLKPDENELAAYAFFSIGYLLYQGNKTEKALSAYDKVIALKPDFVEAYNILGILRSELGQYDKALADYAAAIRVKPDYAEAYAYRGVLKAYLGRINKARLDFQKALELAEQQGNDTLKAFIEERLQELNNLIPQDSEN